MPRVLNSSLTKYRGMRSGICYTDEGPNGYSPVRRPPAALANRSIDPVRGLAPPLSRASLMETPFRPTAEGSIRYAAQRSLDCQSAFGGSGGMFRLICGPSRIAPLTPQGVHLVQSDALPEPLHLPWSRTVLCTDGWGRAEGVAKAARDLGSGACRPCRHTAHSLRKLGKGALQRTPGRPGRTAPGDARDRRIPATDQAAFVQHPDARARAPAPSNPR